MHVGTRIAGREEPRDQKAPPRRVASTTRCVLSRGEPPHPEFRYELHKGPREPPQAEKRSRWARIA